MHELQLHARMRLHHGRACSAAPRAAAGRPAGDGYNDVMAKSQTYRIPRTVTILICRHVAVTRNGVESAESDLLLHLY